MKIFRQGLIACVLSIISFSFTAKAADTLSLYEQPADNAKVIATVTAGQPIIPIFTQGAWIKVGDPSNGNVGWVNRKSLTAYGDKATGKNSFNAEIQSIGNNSDLQKQINIIMKEMQQQQQELQKQFQQLLQMFKAQ